MPKSGRSRTRFGIKDRHEYLRQDKVFGPISPQDHDPAHSPKVLVYTTTVPISTTIGTGLTMTWPGKCMQIQAESDDAPLTDMTLDIYKNGKTVFDSTDTAFRIKAGQQISLLNYPSSFFWVVGDKLQFLVTATGTARGPVKFIIQFRNDSY